MEPRRRANVDNVDIVHAQYFIEGTGAPRNGKFPADGGEPRLVDIAQRLHEKFVGVPKITLGNVVTADAAADDRDPKQSR